jgi:hypothetical protein
MSSAKEFREYADECMDWARTARSERERAIFLEMAQTWMAAAARLERGPAKWVENARSGGTRKDGPDGPVHSETRISIERNNPNQ